MDVDQESKNGGTINQAGMYQIIAAKFPQIIQALEDGINSRNPAVRVGAAKILLNKILPDLKSVEVVGGYNEDGTKQPVQLLINAGSGFIPATIQFNDTSVGSAPTEQQTVQDVNLAPESTQDNNSNIRSSEAGSS
jgi:hypothetical protein